jgi:small GTP-binding protein
MYDAIFKVVLFGDAGCGKTTLTKRFMTDLFIPGSHMTIGVDFETKMVKVNDTRVKLMIWDFGGEERFRFIFPQYLSGAMGGILMYDITEYSSFAHINDWLSVMNGAKERMPLLLIGGKLDLDLIREITYKEGEIVVKKLGLDDFIECSSKTGENVEKSFEMLTKLMLDRMEYQ